MIFNVFFSSTVFFGSHRSTLPCFFKKKKNLNNYGNQTNQIIFNFLLALFLKNTKNVARCNNYSHIPLVTQKLLKHSSLICKGISEQKGLEFLIISSD